MFWDKMKFKKKKRNTSVSMVGCGTEKTYICFTRGVEIIAKKGKAIDSGCGGWSENID